MQMGKNLSYNEVCARLHFTENHNKYLASELASEKKKSETMAAEIKELKIELIPSNLTLKIHITQPQILKSFKSASHRAKPFLKILLE